MAPQACLRIQTGKRGGRASMKQDTINKLMLRLARRGLNVVRLKGGDPSVFGRVQEERIFLEGKSIAVDVVPGITAISAAAAQFAFPLTHREAARRITLATGRLAGGAGANCSHADMADEQTTLALYMAAAVAQKAAAQLISAGRSPSTPVLIVESVSLPEASARRTTLAVLAEEDALNLSGAPTLLIVGAVAEYAACPAPKPHPESTVAGLIPAIAV
jgi:uroporphyrin-III C-methyltransferase